MTYYNRLKWVLGILLIFGIIFATNRIDSDNFERIKDSTNTIYEDRLVASDLIFDMSQILHALEISLLKDQPNLIIEKYKLNKVRMDELIEKFDQTKLTNEEEKILIQYKSSLSTLENNITRLEVEEGFTIPESLAQIAVVNENLAKLSKIQINEGKRQLLTSNKASDSIKFFSKMEFYMMLFLAILIQIVVMYIPTKVVNINNRK